MQQLSWWTIVQLVVFVAFWVILFCIIYIIQSWLARRKNKKL